MAVLSERLVPAHVANRWFPKVRSWLTLGAPLELLSALSVARVVAVVAWATWCAGAVVTPGLGVDEALLAATSVLVAHLVRARLFAVASVVGLGAAGSAATAASMAASDVGSAARWGVLIVLLAIMVGLFAEPRAVVVHQLTTGALLGAAVVVNGRSALRSDVIVLWTAGALAALTTVVTCRSARSGGQRDPDTGLPNSRGIEERLERLRGGGPVLVCTLELQGVASAREALGHRVATELVRRAVEDLGQVLPSAAVIGRASDDDLHVVAPLAGPRAVVLDGIETAIGAGRYLIGSIEVGLVAHVGSVTVEPGDPTEATELLRRSKLAAAAAASSGVAHREWDGTTTTLTSEDLALLADLRHAADRGELWLAYQPQVDVGAGAVASVEALLRWTSDRHGTVPPGRFIPLAERTGLVDRLTDWVLAEALDAQARWRSAGRDLHVSVNVSPQSLRTVDFTTRVAGALDARGLPASALTLEVTESMAFDIPEAVDRLGPLRELGVRISIDDFGTGYTSLAVLPHLPLDELKVDQQYIRNLRGSAANAAIVASVLDLAHRLGLVAVAEGVEDAGLAAHVAGVGYDVLQGFHFARPLPEAELLAFVDSYVHVVVHPDDDADLAAAPG